MKECVFCKIVKTGNNNNEKERNVILYEDDLVLSFYDIDPKAPYSGYWKSC